MKYTRGYKEYKFKKSKVYKPSKSTAKKYYKLQEKARRERVTAAAKRLRAEGYNISVKSVGAVQKMKGLTRKQTEAELLKRGTATVGRVKVNAYTYSQAKKAEARELLSAKRSQAVTGWFKIGKPKKAVTLQDPAKWAKENRDIPRRDIKIYYTKYLTSYAKNRGYKVDVSRYKKELYVENFNKAFDKGYSFLPSKIKNQLKRWFTSRVDEWTLKNYEGSDEIDMVIGEYAYNSDGKSSLDYIAEALGFAAEWRLYKDNHTELQPYFEMADMKAEGKTIDISTLKDNKIVPFKSQKNKKSENEELKQLRAERDALEMKYQSTSGVMMFDNTLSSWTPEDKKRYSELNKKIFLMTR